MIIFQVIPSFADNFFRKELSCMKGVNKNWNKYIKLASLVLVKKEKDKWNNRYQQILGQLKSGGDEKELTDELMREMKVEKEEKKGEKKKIRVDKITSLLERGARLPNMNVDKPNLLTFWQKLLKQILFHFMTCPLGAKKIKGGLVEKNFDNTSFLLSTIFISYYDIVKNTDFVYHQNYDNSNFSTLSQLLSCLFDFSLFHPFRYYSKHQEYYKGHKCVNLAIYQSLYEFIMIAIHFLRDKHPEDMQKFGQEYTYHFQIRNQNHSHQLSSLTWHHAEDSKGEEKAARLWISECQMNLLNVLNVLNEGPRSPVKNEMESKMENKESLLSIIIFDGRLDLLIYTILHCPNLFAQFDLTRMMDRFLRDKDCGREIFKSMLLHPEARRKFIILYPLIFFDLVRKREEELVKLLWLKENELFLLAKDSHGNNLVQHMKKIVNSNNNIGGKKHFSFCGYLLPRKMSMKTFNLLQKV